MKKLKKISITVLLLFILCFVGCGAENTTTDITQIPDRTNTTETKPTNTPVPTATPIPTNTPIPTSAAAVPSRDLPKDSYFEVHFLDVGQADAMVVVCDGRVMMIDGGNADDSDFIYSYLKKHKYNTIDYMVATHPHEDHVGGLSGALNYAVVKNVYCSVTKYDTKTFQNFQKYVEKEGEEIVVPKVGDTFKLGSALVEVIGVMPKASDMNNTSIVLMVTYGETKFLFAGDANREAEQVILDSGYPLECDVLKVGHHGSENATTYPFLRAIMPKYAVICVGEKNDYGHPTENALSRLRDAEVTLFRTDLHGTVTAVSDGKTVEFSVEKNESADPFIKKIPKPTSKPEPTSVPDRSQNGEDTGTQTGWTYVLNTNTKKFHYSDCSSAKQIKDSNRDIFTGSRDDLIDMGYSPCGRCDP